MRKILFRGKRTDNGEWVCWNVYGELCKLNGKRTRLAIPKTAGESCYYYIYQIKHLIDKETVGQFTALTDKNGKKIFEGDYVINKFDEGTEEEITCIEYVGFMDGSFGFFDHIVGESPTEDTFTPFEYCILENTTFCGNIHDNPELLKEGAE